MSLLRVVLPKPREYWWTTIAGEPQPKERPRVLRSGRTFTPKRTVEAQKAIAWAVKCAHPNLKCDSSSEFGLRCVFYCARRRDGDNCAKLVRDALERVAWE